MPFSLDLATVLFLLWIFVIAPVLAVLAWLKLRSGKPLRPKIWRFQVGCLVLLIEGALALAAGTSNSLTLSFRPPPTYILLGILMALLMVISIQRRWQNIDVEHRSRQLKLFGPENTTEWYWSILIGLCAAIFEEVAYRGVLFGLLLRVLPTFTAAAVCILAFALAHVTQGIRGFTGVAIIGILFHILLALTGSLTAGIVLHAVYDVGLFTVMYRMSNKERATAATAS